MVNWQGWVWSQFRPFVLSRSSLRVSHFEGIRWYYRTYSSYGNGKSRRQGSRNTLCLLWSRLGIIKLLPSFTFYWPNQAIWPCPIFVGQEVYFTSSRTVKPYIKGHGIERRKELGTKINLPVAKHNDQCFMFILWNSIVTLQKRGLVRSCGLSPWHSEWHTSPGFPSTFLGTHSQTLFFSSPLSLWQSERRWLVFYHYIRSLEEI